MRMLAELRDPFGIVLALASAVTVMLVQEGPLLALICAAAVIAARVGIGLVVQRVRPTKGIRSVSASGAEWYAPLTKREAEVAELVSQGLTNREIAERLVVSERTVDNHVFHVMNKLGVDSRTQIGVWVVQRRMRVGANTPKHA